MTDLHDVEYMMALEEAAENRCFPCLPEVEREYLERVSCSAYDCSLRPVDRRPGCPDTVLVIARAKGHVLFYTGIGECFGVGVELGGVIGEAAIYPSLGRAVFALSKS